MYFSTELWALALCVRQLHISNIPHFRALSYKSLSTNPELYSELLLKMKSASYTCSLFGSYHVVAWLTVEADGSEKSKWHSTLHGVIL